jgi:hypothetical protein
MSLDINLTNVQSKPIVVSANQTAENDRVYHVVANATFTDPTGVNGKGYEVFVRNGTATINSVAYTEGTTILRLFHSGAWVSYLGGGSQNLQQVTDIGNDTTNGIITTNSFVAFDDISSPDNYSVLSPNYLELGTNSTGEQLFLFSNNIQFVRGNGAIAGTFKATNVTSPNNVTLEFPNKTTGSYTIATTADIPNTSDFVEKSDFTSHSILAKQSGAGDPVAVSIGNNEILGRKSGGGSNIEGLSVSEVKSLLNYTASDVGAVATNSAITGATKTKITYDAKGLVTSGADATTADIADSSNKRYVTDANLTVIGNTSNTNTGDETQSSIFSKLGWFNIVNQVAGTVSSGTANTITKSIALPSVPNVLNFRVVFSKTGTNANWIVRAYVSEVDNNIGGTAVLIATSPLAGGSITYLPIKRTVDFIAGNIITINQTTATLTDDAQATSRLNTAFPTGTPLYLIFAVQCTSGSDSARFETCMINNFTF